MKKATKNTCVGLIDCNNFFVSCERIFRPDIEEKPVIVLSSNDGCVISRSQEAKQLGIAMGIPYFEIKQIIREKNIVVFSSNFTLYRDISARVMDIAASLQDHLEVYSIDEAFFSLPSTNGEAQARKLIDSVRRHVGIPVSVGVASTKTLAKLAGARAKKNGGFAQIIHADPTVAATSLREIWGVGARTSERLAKQGILTVNDVLSHGPKVLREEIGVVGERLYYELSGTQAESVHASTQTSMMSTRSFGKHVREFAVLQDAVSHHLSEVARKLREQQTKVPGVVVHLRFIDSEGRTCSVSHTVRFPCLLSDTRSMATAVCSTLKNVFDSRARYTKAGIVAYHITDAEALQAALFEVQHDPSNDALMQVVDGLNIRFGARAVRMGTQQSAQAWKSRAQFLSPSYTTSWTSLPMANMG
jgi:DNA polymerase V